jgi:hypothetical protein
VVSSWSDRLPPGSPIAAATAVITITPLQKLDN